MDSYSDERPSGKQAEALARSISIPYGILERANIVWKKENVLHADPKTHFQQKLGLVIST